MGGKDEKDYSFYLMPGKKMRHISGPLDIQMPKQIFDVKVNIQSRLRKQIEIDQILFGSPGNCQRAWDIKNNSKETILVTINEGGIEI